MLLREAINLFCKHLIVNERSPETLRAYRLELSNFARFLESQYNGPAFLEEVTIREIEEYLHDLKMQGGHASRRSRLVYIFRSFYNFATRRDFISVNVAVRIDPVKVQQKERTFLSDQEYEDLVAVINHDLVKALVSTLFMTGLRIKEALDLTLDDVDLTGKIIRVKHGKGNKSRVVPISDRLLVILCQYIDKIRPKCKSQRFFATKVTGQLSPDLVNKILKEAVAKLGWNKKVTCHILRHSFASHLVRNNVNIVRVQKLLGHSSLKTTSIYTHTTMDELAEAVNTF